MQIQTHNKYKAVLGVRMTEILLKANTRNYKMSAKCMDLIYNGFDCSYSAELSMIRSFITSRPGLSRLAAYDNNK